MKKLNLYLYFLCIAFAPAMASGSDYDKVCMVGALEDSCYRLTELSSCKNNPKCIWSATDGCSLCSIGKYVNSGSCQSCPTKTVTTPSGENKSYQYTSCLGATSKDDCYYNCDAYCTSMKTNNGTWSLDTSQYSTHPMVIKPTAAAHWDDDLVTKCKCKLTCTNANDYCSDDGETPNGYHVVGSYFQGTVKSTCQPNWQKYTSGTDTGFQYWDDTHQAQSTWSTEYITKCGIERHFDPNTVKTTPKCDKKYGTCESDIQKCDANFLGNCYVSYAKSNGDGDVYGNITSTTGQLKWVGNETTDKWTVSSGECKCRVDDVPIMECVGRGPARNCKEIGKKQVVLSYTGNGRKGARNDTLWDKAKDTVTSCADGYYANADKTACIPVEDGYYSPEGKLNRMDCKEVPYSGPTDNYYNHSDGARSNAANCYVNCSERADYLNDKGGDSLKGEWQWKGEPDGKRYASSQNSSCDEDLRLYCNENYYVFGTGETRQCKLCSNLADSSGNTGYWNKSMASNLGGETSCYAQCSDSDKKPSAPNGEFTATSSMVYYNAVTKAKCEYTLACNEGYYRKNDGKNCDMCPVGSTSDKGADAITKCYMKGGPDGTEFCDNHGCFNLPTSVKKIFYVGN